MLRIRIATAVEHPEEREHRHREQRRDASLRRFKDITTTVIIWAFFIGLAVQLYRFLGSGHGG